MVKSRYNLVNLLNIIVGGRPRIQIQSGSGVCVCSLVSLQHFVNLLPLSRHLLSFLLFFHLKCGTQIENIVPDKMD